MVGQRPKNAQPKLHLSAFGGSFGERNALTNKKKQIDCD
jgi:hypothetical protein